jgi:hypothetical protein
VRKELLRKAGVIETNDKVPAPTPVEPRTKPEVAPPAPQPGEAARPAKAAFHAVIDAAIAELAGEDDGEARLLAAELLVRVVPVDRDRLARPLALAAVSASAAAMAGAMRIRPHRRLRNSSVRFAAGQSGGGNPTSGVGPRLGASPVRTTE